MLTSVAELFGGACVAFGVSMITYAPRLLISIPSINIAKRLIQSFKPRAINSKRRDHVIKDIVEQTRLQSGSEYIEFFQVSGLGRYQRGVLSLKQCCERSGAHDDEGKDLVSTSFCYGWYFC